MLVHPDGGAELSKLPVRELLAMDSAFDNCGLSGQLLGSPHTSAVKAADNIRELRPRQGRSPWRSFYRRIGQALVVGAIGPESSADPQGFDRAVRSAEQRLNDVEEDA